MKSNSENFRIVLLQFQMALCEVQSKSCSGTSYQFELGTLRWGEAVDLSRYQDGSLRAPLLPQRLVMVPLVVRRQRSVTVLWTWPSVLNIFPAWLDCKMDAVAEANTEKQRRWYAWFWILDAFPKTRTYLGSRTKRSGREHMLLYTKASLLDVAGFVQPWILVIRTRSVHREESGS